MDRFSLPADHLRAGAEYLSALRELGLEPDGLLWAWDDTISEFAFVLVTSQLDHVGPLGIYRLLTLAYNVSATPQEISPFVVRLHSPKQLIFQRIHKALNLHIRIEPGEIFQIGSKAGDLSFKSEWIYVLQPRRMRPAERVRRWNRFRERAERLAA